MNYLQSDDYTKIHPLNRAQIIDDAFFFMVSGQLDIMMSLNLIDYLSEEIDFIPWYSIFQALRFSENIYKVPENEFLKENSNIIT